MPLPSLGSLELRVVSYHAVSMLKQPVENPVFQGTDTSSPQPCEGAILAAARPAPVKPSDETAAL